MECTNDDKWNCKYCRKVESCEANKAGTTVSPPITVGLGDSERLEWLMRNVSGKEFRRLGVTYGGNCGRDRIDAAMMGHNVKVLHGDRLATAATAKKYAQIEINRLNGLNRSEVTA